MEMGRENMNNIEEDKLEKLKNEISDLEKMLEKKRELEELERKKAALEEELGSGIKKIENDIQPSYEENEEAPTEDSLKNIGGNKDELLEEDEEVEYVSYEEVAKKMRNKWIFIGVASVIVAVGITTFFLRNRDSGNKENIESKIKEIKEIKEEAEKNAQIKAKSEMDRKLAEEVEKLRIQSEMEAERKSAENNVVINNEETTKEKEPEKKNPDKVLTLPKVDTGQLDELLGKKAEEAQKNVEGYIEERGGVEGIFNDISSGVGSIVKNVEGFFSDIFNNDKSETSENKTEEKDKK